MKVQNYKIKVQISVQLQDWKNPYFGFFKTKTKIKYSKRIKVDPYMKRTRKQIMYMA